MSTQSQKYSQKYHSVFHYRAHMLKKKKKKAYIMLLSSKVCLDQCSLMSHEFIRSLWFLGGGTTFARNVSSQFPFLYFITNNWINQKGMGGERVILHGPLLSSVRNEIWIGILASKVRRGSRVIISTAVQYQQ